MSTSVGTSPDANWKTLFEAALVELDSSILLDRIGAARAAIHNRLKELETEKFCDETMRLLDTLSALDDLLRMRQRNAA